MTDKLSVPQCLPLVRAMLKGVLGIGLWESLSRFGDADSQPANSCAGSIHSSYSKGSDFQGAVLGASPRLPDHVAEILIAGFENSVLDHALADMEQAMLEREGSRKMEKGLLSLLEKYGRTCTTEICQGCFEREMESLISQARAERATGVELRQLGESFLELRFSGDGSRHVRRASHSLVYTTLLQKLTMADKLNTVIRIGGEPYRIRKSKLASFKVSRDNKQALHIAFMGKRDS